MKERPILFSGEMVRAILDSRKSQTRRVINLPLAPNLLGQWEPFTHGGAGITDSKGNATVERPAIWHTRTGKLLVCPYGQVGDRLWVREAFCEPSLGAMLYRADERPHEGVYSYRKWRSSTHMPRWASRITLEITGVKVERIQEITGANCLAEGIDKELCRDWHGDNCFLDRDAARDNFADLWDSINAKRGYGWDVNPFVWCISFRVVT